jgi:AbrB family looped-hinge helix DNA binding protein
MVGHTNVIAISDMDAKGRITIPSKVRRELGLAEDGAIAFIKEKDGRITIRPADRV